MTDLEIKCFHCGVAMDPGYLADGGHGLNVEVAKWVGGAPDVRWHGLSTEGHDQIPLSAYRCAKCGYVEFRAIPARAT